MIPPDVGNPFLCILFALCIGMGFSALLLILLPELVLTMSLICCSYLLLAIVPCYKAVGWTLIEYSGWKGDWIMVVGGKEIELCLLSICHLCQYIALCIHNALSNPVWNSMSWIQWFILPVTASENSSKSIKPVFPFIKPCWLLGLWSLDVVYLPSQSWIPIYTQ